MVETLDLVLNSALIVLLLVSVCRPSVCRKCLYDKVMDGLKRKGIGD